VQNIKEYRNTKSHRTTKTIQKQNKNSNQYTKTKYKGIPTIYIYNTKE